MTQIHFSSAMDRRQRGLSLIELMVAMTISLILIAGVIQIYLSTRQTHVMQDGMARMQEHARFALDRLTQEIGAAGFLGCMRSGDNEYPVVNTLSNQGAAGRYDFGTAVFGVDNTGVGGTDILTIRRGGSGGGIRLTAPMTTALDNLQLDSADGAYAQLEQFDILAVSDCFSASVFMITNDPRTSGGLIQHAPSITATSGPNTGQSNATNDLQFIYGTETASVTNAYQVTGTTYFVDASTSGSGNSLYINTVDANNELIEGVEDFQVQYGVNIDGDLGVDRYVDAGNVTDGGTDWNDVVALRITLRINTVVPVQSGNTLSKTFTTTIRLRNRGEVI